MFTGGNYIRLKPDSTNTGGRVSLFPANCALTGE